MLVNKIFASLIRKKMDVYVYNMLVKNFHILDHVHHLKVMFKVLRRYRMKLNPENCKFVVTARKFLGYIVNLC